MPLQSPLKSYKSINIVRFCELAENLQNKNIGSFRVNLRKLVNSGKIKFEIGHYGKGVRRIYRLERQKEKNEETRAVKVFGPEA